MRNILDPLLIAVALDGPAQIWTQLPDFPGTARDDAATFALDEDIYVGTGMEVGWALTTDWWRYSAFSGQWSSVASLPASGRQYCTAFGELDKGYLFGGLDSSGALNELWEYDDGTDTWTQLPSLPGPGRYAGVGWINSGTAYIATGMMDGNVPTKEFWSYDTGLQQWTQLDDVPGPSRHRAMCFGNGYVAGGADSSWQALEDAYYYSGFIGAQWAQISPLPQPRYGAGGSSGSYHIICGASGAPTLHDEAWQYLSFWDPVPAFPGGGRRGGVCSAFFGLSGEVFFGLGLDDSLVRHDDWWSIQYAGGISDVVSMPLTVHPNPGTDVLTIDPCVEAPLHLRIHDIGARTFHQSVIAGSTSLDPTNWASGVYVIEAEDEQGLRYRTRWIKL
ncbi:MAG: kelch repeat-containing protein [Flavobacteriales bacterium]